MSLGQYASANPRFDTAHVATLIGQFPLTAVQRMTGYAMADVKAVADSLWPKPHVEPIEPDYSGQQVLSLWKGLITIPVRPVTMLEIAELVAARHKLSVEELRGPSLRRKIAHARQEAMALTYATGRFSTTQVGRYYSRDHTTVIHARRRHAERELAAIGIAAE